MTQDVTLRAASDAARRFTHAVGEISFECLLPTRFTERAIGRQAWSAGEFDVIRFERLVLQTGVVGWNGPRESHIVPGADSTPLAFSAGTLALVLDERTDWFDSLAGEFLRRFDARRSTFEEAAKNSEGASSGKD